MYSTVRRGSATAGGAEGRHSAGVRLLGRGGLRYLGYVWVDSLLLVATETKVHSTYCRTGHETLGRLLLQQLLGQGRGSGVG